MTLCRHCRAEAETVTEGDGPGRLTRTFRATVRYLSDVFRPDAAVDPDAVAELEPGETCSRCGWKRGR